MTILVKQDINFLENPLWMQNVEQDELGLTWKDKEGYLYKTAYKAPVKTDIIFLYYFLLEAQSNSWSNKLELSRYEILNNCGLRKDKWWYERLEESLMRWAFIKIGYKNIFYDGKYKSGIYGIIHEYELPGGRSKVKIELSEKFLNRIKESQFFKLIDFEEIKKLKTPLSTRLYEILCKTFKGRDEWSIDAHKLANKIPMKEEYLAHIIPKIKAAVSRISKNTNLKMALEIRKKERGRAILIFHKIKQTIPQKSKASSKNKVLNSKEEAAALARPGEEWQQLYSRLRKNGYVLSFSFSNF